MVEEEEVVEEKADRLTQLINYVAICRALLGSAKYHSKAAGPLGKINI